jgi:hypothetical protein
MPYGDPFNFGPIIAQGWQCPCCQRVYSPTTPMCFTCGGKQAVRTGGTGDPLPEQPGSICDTPHSVRS